MRSILPAAAAIILLSVAVAAPAQLETKTGSRIPTPAPADIPEDPYLSPAERARVTTFAFGQCTILRHRKAVDQALAISPMDKKRDAALDDVATSECLRAGALRMPQNVMIGALYQALYRADFGKLQPALLPTQINFYLDVEGAAGDPGAMQYVALRQFGDCVVRANPAESRTLMLSPVAGKKETAAFAALAPSFSGCMGAGQTFTFSKAVIGGLIAEALYRESKAAASLSVAER